MEIEPLYENEWVVFVRPPFREDFDEYKKEKGVESGYVTHGAMVRRLNEKYSKDTRAVYILCTMQTHRKYTERVGSFIVTSNGQNVVCVVYGSAQVPTFGGVIDEMKLMAWI